MVKTKEDVNKRVEWLQSEQYSAAGDIFGEPKRTARVGDEYQAQIPSLMTEDERLQLITLPCFHDVKTDGENQFEFGLPIPVTWVQHQHKNKKKPKKIEKGKSGNLPIGLVPVPCSSGVEESWSVIDHDSFLLGLYIFGKNLRVVNEFVGNKGMQSVISYYYGKFYRSCEHKKWSMYRKKRNRKSVPGKKFFRGWRREELLSRLLPGVADECKTRLAQVSSMFDEGKLTFEKYIFTLRDTVGIDLLTEAIAIGNEKRDLMNKTRRRMKNEKIHSESASLKTEEIVNILKDRIGLSKGRLNDIFWEAVWPRLLAKGWHSEEIKNFALQNSKDSLVFLAPGVEKFSRRSLEKGIQYFDSFTDVLNKISSEPQLLDQERDQERLVDDKQDLMKYTIVDTSLIGNVKVREVTSLSNLCSVSGETENNTTEESQNRDVKMDTSTDEKPVRKLKVIFKQKEKRERVDNTRHEKIEDEDKEHDLQCEKKRKVKVTDSNNPRAGLVSEVGGNGQRQSRRNRLLTTKALEALDNEFLEIKKKRKELEGGASRRVRAKTALVSSCGIENNVDGVFNGSSQMSDSDKGGDEVNVESTQAEVESSSKAAGESSVRTGLFDEEDTETAETQLTRKRKDPSGARSYKDYLKDQKKEKKTKRFKLVRRSEVNPTTVASTTSVRTGLFDEEDTETAETQLTRKRKDPSGARSYKDYLKDQKKEKKAKRFKLVRRSEVNPTTVASTTSSIPPPTTRPLQQPIMTTATVTSTVAGQSSSSSIIIPESAQLSALNSMLLQVLARQQAQDDEIKRLSAAVEKGKKEMAEMANTIESHTLMLKSLEEKNKQLTIITEKRSKKLKKITRDYKALESNLIVGEDQIFRLRAPDVASAEPSVKEAEKDKAASIGAHVNDIITHVEKQFQNTRNMI